MYGVTEATPDLKSVASNGVRVRLPLHAFLFMKKIIKRLVIIFWLIPERSKIIPIPEVRKAFWWLRRFY